jgi:8-oxoguanine deaminase
MTRAHPQAINKELFLGSWRSTRSGALPRPRQFSTGVRLALTSCCCRLTTASDHHYAFPAGLEDAMDIENEEALALGMRMTLTRGSVNRGTAASPTTA